MSEIFGEFESVEKLEFEPVTPDEFKILYEGTATTLHHPDWLELAKARKRPLRSQFDTGTEYIAALKKWRFEVPVTGRDPKPRNCLERAQAIVNGPRRETYGHPKDNHSRTAALWSTYLGIPISCRQVCMINILQKIARDMHVPKEDNLDDIAGYVLNAEMVGDA